MQLGTDPAPLTVPKHVRANVEDIERGTHLAWLVTAEESTGVGTVRDTLLASELVDLQATESGSHGSRGLHERRSREGKRVKEARSCRSARETAKAERVRRALH